MIINKQFGKCDHCENCGFAKMRFKALLSALFFCQLSWLGHGVGAAYAGLWIA